MKLASTSEHIRPKPLNYGVKPFNPVQRIPNTSGEILLACISSGREMAHAGTLIIMHDVNG